MQKTTGFRTQSCSAVGKLSYKFVCPVLSAMFARVKKSLLFTNGSERVAMDQLIAFYHKFRKGIGKFCQLLFFGFVGCYFLYRDQEPFGNLPCG